MKFLKFFLCILHDLNPTCSGGGAHCARPSENMLLFFTVWSEGPQILVKFMYHSDIGCTESLEPKVCLKKNWSMFFDAGVKNQKIKNGKIKSYLIPCTYKK